MMAAIELWLDTNANTLHEIHFENQGLMQWMRLIKWRTSGSSGSSEYANVVASDRVERECAPPHASLVATWVSKRMQEYWKLPLWAYYDKSYPAKPSFFALSNLVSGSNELITRSQIQFLGCLKVTPISLASPPYTRFNVHFGD